MFTEEEIKIKANTLLEDTQLGNEFPLPIELIASHLGFKCHLYIPDEDIKDIASAFSHTKKKIYVNQDNPFEQQLFTVARKIGHIVLHGDDRDYIDESIPADDRQAQEAELFATHLLMPDNIFIREWNRYPQDFQTLAIYFGVTSTLVKLKAESLGLIKSYSN